MQISDGFVGTIGNTPLIKLRKASELTGCDILGKAEFLNPGSSVKDRAAWVDSWTDTPFSVVEGIEFRAVTVTARKGKEGPCYEGNHAVIYKGPWKQVGDDDGHLLRRGERTAVCAKTFRIFSQPPYAEHLIPVPPRVEVPEGEQKAFDSTRSAARHPRETKGEAYNETSEESGGCCPPSAA